MSSIPNPINSPFVHLRLHSEFSVVDGTVRIDEAAKTAADFAQTALAITDFNNLFGAVKFYKEGRGQGIKPIIGAELLLDMGGAEAVKEAATSRIVLLVQNKTGYLNLCELISRGWTKNAVRANAVCKLVWLQELSEGLILLSGAQAGPLGAALLQGDEVKAHELALELATMFPHRFYIELQRAGRADDEAHVVAAVKLAARVKLPVVATHPVQFLKHEDYEAHEARICISEGEILGNARRVRKFTREQYFKSSQEMVQLFADVPSALANTLEIAKRCSLTLELGKSKLPHFPTPPVNGQQLSPEDYFRHASHEGLKQRMLMLYPDAAEREKQMPQYLARLEFEIGTILKMGFPGYFLIVGDFIQWAKVNGCPVGPGRGSGAGSLVAYALKITDLEPAAIQAAV
jgi:DNA polymerase III subunit alpha